jgi:hypothetical protein
MYRRPLARPAAATPKCLETLEMKAARCVGILNVCKRLSLFAKDTCQMTKL